MTPEKNLYIKKSVNEIKFELPSGETLFINLNAPLGLVTKTGMERIWINNDKDKVTVEARGNSGSKFVFSKKKKLAEKEAPIYELVNPENKVLLEDYLASRFWSQFNWGELARLKRNKKFERKLTKRIQKLVKEFESKAAKELNELSEVGALLRFKK